jgi:hypothetical protein
LAITVLGALIALGDIANFNFMFGVEKTAMLICGAIVLAAGCVGLVLAMHGAAPLVSPEPPGLGGEATRRRTVWDRIAVLLLTTAALVTGYLLMSYSARVKLETVRQATRGAEEARLAATRGRKVHFGRVTETLIAKADADDEGWGLFDLETGKSFEPPFPLKLQANRGPALVELTPELKEWIKARGVDLLLHLGATNWDVMTLGMQEEYAGQPNEWGDVSPEKVIGLFAKKDGDHLVRDEVPASSFGHSYRGEYGSVTAFRTRRNVMGIYQIKGMGSINRRGVGIRYKLVVERGETALEGRMEELGTEDNDAVVWKLAWAQDRHLDAQREVAMFEVQLSQLLGRAKGASPITASGGQTEKEIQRVKNDLTIAQEQVVLLSQEVTRLEAMLKRPGKLSSSLEAVPLTTQLSEALRTKAAAEKDVTDLESLLLHAGEGLKTSPDSPEARFNT